jgi:hypothetical protein
MIQYWDEGEFLYTRIIPISNLSFLIRLKIYDPKLSLFTHAWAGAMAMTLLFVMIYLGRLCQYKKYILCFFIQMITIFHTYIKKVRNLLIPNMDFKIIKGQIVD